MALERRDVIIHLPEHKLADKSHAEHGQRLLGKLREEMMAVTITESKGKPGVITTGGKRSVGGEYTRDDALSAFLLLCHTRDELHVGDGSIRIYNNVY